MWGWLRRRFSLKKTPEVLSDDGFEEATPFLVDLLEAHGMTSVTTHNGFVFTSDDWPAIRARFEPQGEGNRQCLDVELWLDRHRAIYERYPGSGSDDAEAKRNALAYFCGVSLHVYLAAFWNQRCCDQVDEEIWTVKGEVWNAYISPCVQRATDGQKILVPLEFLPALQALVEGMSFKEDVVSISSFYGGLPEARLAEVRVNNEVNATLSEALKALPWPESTVFYSMRNFIVLTRQVQSSQP